MRTEAEGLSVDEQAALTAIASLPSWHLEWQDDVCEWHTAVLCPSCGAHLRFEVSALADFYCTACDYDWIDDAGPRQKPTPGTL
ncbi:hypothetical protein QZM25_31605 [Burkholderia contaminans]|uniref:hypothetical protein n=1 Tax=Burkholderia contaminans TaxID=488447 RepID=UPI001CF120D4|nr:hypothetical protein [Burkholderia contaminans]MCA7889628.1 hypothetical protein [Burkholderia contaminans]MDN7577163.1 hypothetical protein [Burkholderia contaminans]